MLSVLKHQDSSGNADFSPIPDPWDALAEEAVVVPPHPWLIPLDTSHELTGVPERSQLAPYGHPGALQLPGAKAPVLSAVALLLQDELKLAGQADAHLRDEICGAIAWLELLCTAGGE